MKFDQFDESNPMKDLNCDKNSLNVIKIYHCDEKQLMWREPFDVMKVGKLNENLSIGWKLIVIEIYHCDENLWL